MAKSQGKSSEKKNETLSSKRQSLKPKKVSAKRKMTDLVFENVCRELATRWHGLNTICLEFNSSASAFHDYLNNDPNGKKSDRYMRARKMQAEYLFDMQRETVMDRSEDHTAFTGANVVNRDRLISDTIKWQASKLDTKKYGDKIEVEGNQNININWGKGED